MKSTFAMRTLVGLSALVLTHNAFADWQVGRERPVQSAQLNVSTSEGTFEGLNTVRVTQSVISREEQSQTFFTLQIQGQSLRLAIREVEMNRCGRTTYHLTPVHKGIQLGLERHEIVLQQDSLWGSRCGSSVESTDKERTLEVASEELLDSTARGAARWTLIYKHTGVGTTSHFVAEGKPEMLYTTLSIQADSTQPVKP